MIARAHPIDLLFVIAPHSLLLDIAGPAEAFRLANLHRDGARPAAALPAALRRARGQRGRPRSGLGWRIWSRCRERCTTPTWVVLVGQPSAQLRPGDAGDRRVGAVARPDPAGRCSAIRTAPHRVLAICSGALLAARAGLLRRAPLHHPPRAARRAPRAGAARRRSIDNRVFVVDGPLASSAGITAGIDLALHLIAEECGEALAASVAEDMVVYLRRSPRDPELSPFLVHRRHLHAAVHRVQDAILAEPERDWDMAALAAVGHATGAPPAAAVHGSRRRVAAALSAVDPAGAGPAVARVGRERHAGRGGRRVPVGAAAAPCLEPSVGWLAAGCRAGGRAETASRMTSVLATAPPVAWQGVHPLHRPR